MYILTKKGGVRTPPFNSTYVSIPSPYILLIQIQS